MFWGKKPEETNAAVEKPLAAEASSKWALDSAAQAPEKSAWDSLVVKVLDAQELESMLSGRFGKLRSALGVGTLIQGRLSFDTPVRIDGKLSGEVFSSEALIVGSSGVVDASLEVASLIVLGTVKGKVKASQRVEVYSGGRLEAEVVSPLLKIEDGAHFGGKCSMPAQIREQRTVTPGSKTGEGRADKGDAPTGKSPGVSGAQLQ